MFYHKSCGVLALGLLFPRIALRLTSRLPAAVEGTKLEHFAANASHVCVPVGNTISAPSIDPSTNGRIHR